MNRLTLPILVAVLVPYVALHSQHPALVNKTVPATPCKGGGDCDSGQNVCRPTSSRGPGAATITFSDSGYSVRSDGMSYANGTANVVAVASNAAALLFRPPPAGDRNRLRRISVDLNHPVPGDIASPLGVVTDTLWVDLNAQWKTDSDFTQHNLAEIPIGTTVNAEQLNVGFALNGIAHALQMGPQPWGHCFSNGTAIFGTGTTRATITRLDPSAWVIDLPPGSIGRLFDVHLHDPHAVNRGLYYVSLHFVARRSTAPTSPNER